MANSFYMDASALAKRYIPEKGNELVDEILDKLPPSRIHLLNIASGEILSVLVRKRNAAAMSIANFEEAVASFDAEIVGGMRVTKASVTSRLITGSFPLIITHSINSTDALTLKSALAIARKLRRTGDDLVLVASDQRLFSGCPGRRVGHP